MNAPTVCLFEYDGTPYLKKLTTYASGTSPVKEFSNPLFEAFTKIPGFTTINNNVTLVNFDGTGSRQDILAGVDILTYSGTGSGSLSKKTNSTIIPDVPEEEQFIPPLRFIFSDHVFAGNFNGNEQGKEQLSVLTMIPYYYDDPENYEYWYAFNCGVEHKIYDVSGTTLNQTYKHSPQYPRVMGVGVKQHADGEHLNPLVNWQNASIPFTGIARSAEAARTLKYVGHTVTMTEPRIYALLAAPPFFKYKTNGEPLEYGGSTSMGTVWGATTTSGSGTANESAYRATAMVGFEQEFNAPILAINLGGFELEAHLEFEWTGTEEKEFETTQSIEWVAPNNDAVILSASFTDSYEYEIISSENPDEIGGKISISIPSGEPRTMGLNLEDYNRLAADNDECPDLREVFKHKVGYPFTYPSDKSQIKSNLQVVSGDPTQPTSQVLWATGGGSEFVSTGSGNDVTLSIELTETTTESTGFNFSLDVEAIAKFPCGLKVGAGGGFTKGSSHSHIEGVGHGVAGTVPSPENINDTPSFQWTLGWYKYGIAVGNKTQEFPIVYYVVKP